MHAHTAVAANGSRVPEFHCSGARANVDGMTRITIAVAASDAAIRRCFPVMRQLRPHLDEARYMELATQMVRSGEYKLAYVEANGAVTTVAGYRFMDLLFANGKVLYVDDLVTDENARSKGHGRALFQWLLDHARENGCVSLTLDSGVQRHDAHRFYFRERMQIAAHHFTIALQVDGRQDSQRLPG
jgi:GNAT superfamily N-acetyltransferase